MNDRPFALPSSIARWRWAGVRLVVLCGAIAGTGACREITDNSIVTGPWIAEYDLLSVAGTVLPAPPPFDTAAISVIRGSLRLNARGGGVLEWVVRSADDPSAPAETRRGELAYEIREERISWTGTCPDAVRVQFSCAQGPSYSGVVDGARLTIDSVTRALDRPAVARLPVVYRRR